MDAAGRLSGDAGDGLVGDERRLHHESAGRGGVGGRAAPLESDQGVDHLVGPILLLDLHLINMT